MRAPVRPSERWLYRRGARQLAALAAALQRAGGNPGIRRATDAYDAGKLLNERPQRMLDLVAAIVLARDGLRALADKTPAPCPPCLVNPLHGPGPHAIDRFRFSKESVPYTKVPACAVCATMRELDWQVLMVVDGDGWFRPYCQIDEFWSKTGFGAFESDFPRRVLGHLGVDRR